MTDSVASPSFATRAADRPVDGAELASMIAGKLCHDFISPAGAISSGLDLLNDPSAQDMRDDALGLIDQSARKMAALVQFARVAFGSAGGGERFAPAELAALTDALAQGGRAVLDWRLDDGEIGKRQARALVNLAFLTLAALPSGGVAVIETRRDGDALVILGRAEGARARLKAEAAEGLAGLPLSEGLQGQWVQPYWLWLTVVEGGGTLEIEAEEGRVNLTARLPN